MQTLRTLLAGLAARFIPQNRPDAASVPTPAVQLNRKPGPLRRRSRIYLKGYPESHPKKRAARAYKRTFKGICGALTWSDLARRLQAGKLQPAV